MPSELDDEVRFVDAAVLTRAIGHDESAWNSLSGVTILHTSLCPGTIVRTQRRPKTFAKYANNYWLWISFDGEPDQFDSESLTTKHFSFLVFESRDLAHPLLGPLLLSKRDIDEREEERRQIMLSKQREEIAKQEALEELRRLEQEAKIEREKRVAEEEAATEEFALLRRRYKAHSRSDSHPSSPLFMILKKLEIGETLSEEDLRFLGIDRQFHIQAEHYVRAFEAGDQWAAARASSAWRQTRNREDAKLAIQFDRNALETVMLPRPKAALLTSLGGAYRDLGQVTEAISSAKLALGLVERSYQPHTLLAAIYFSRGDMELGESHTRSAIERGSPVSDLENSLGSVSDQYKKSAAQYLLGKDPRKYGWARAYI